MKAAIVVLFASGVAAYQNQELVDKVNSAGTTWTAGHNARFADMTLDEMRGLLGTQVPDHAKVRPDTKFVHDVSLPEAFDARDAWPHCESIRMVRDQGHCGSCWAFGAAEAFSDRYCIASRQTQNLVFSPYALVTCDGQNGGCKGGALSYAWNFIQQHGLPLDHCQPYEGINGTTPGCRWGDCFGGGHWDTWSVSSTSDPGCGGRGCDPNAMAAIIHESGPIEGSFTVYEDFMSYKGGVYQHTHGDELGGHAIKIIGWGVEGGIPYWLCTNSWGPGWGLGGFFKIRRGVNEVGIESDNAAGTPIVKR